MASPDYLQDAPLEDANSHPRQRVLRWLEEVYYESEKYHDCNTSFQTIEDWNAYGVNRHPKASLEQLQFGKAIHAGMILSVNSFELRQCYMLTFNFI
jgi:triphosphoribosyl-dephospho-CoA synthetase